MPRRERDRELARRRKRREKRRKLRAKGRLGQPTGPIKEIGKKKPVRGTTKEIRQEETQEASETSSPKA